MKWLKGGIMVSVETTTSTTLFNVNETGSLYPARMGTIFIILKKIVFFDGYIYIYI